MNDDTLGNLDLSILRQRVRSRRLEEEEGFGRSGVVELFDVGCVVAPDGDALRVERRESG